MEDDREILDSVVEAFIDEAPLLLQQLDDAIKSQDATTAERAAHTLKGNFRILRLDDQQACWAEIEAAIRTDGDSRIAEKIELAREITQKALDGLRQYLEQNSTL
ncbi:MAG: Hpt domain-containing protein [Rubripirellula sp.]